MLTVQSYNFEAVNILYRMGEIITEENIYWNMW
jgi:hypothetical protein